MPVLANAKHEAVALAYFADPQKIGWKAYKAVYPSSSQHACETAFSRLLKNAEFSARLADLGEAAASAKVMSAREVLEELSKIGRANLRDFAHLGQSGDVNADVAALSPEQTAAMAELTVESHSEASDEPAPAALEDQAHGGKLKRRKAQQRTVRRVKFKLHAKTTALDLLGKHHKLYVERHEHDFSGVAARLAAAIARTGDQPDRGTDGQDRSPGDPPRGGRARKAAKARKRPRPRGGGVRQDGAVSKPQR